MRRIRPSSEDEMIATFVRAELDSDRFGPSLRAQLEAEGLEERIVTEPDLEDALENEQRRRLLELYRGYGTDTGLFDGFPAAVRWERVALSPEDVRRVRYIKWSYWLELSGGTRLATDAAERIRAGVEAFGVSSDGFHEAAEAFAAGTTTFPELILVSPHEDGPLVVLEGHVRLTAYMLRPDALPSELEALVGYSPEMVRWSEF